MKWHRSIETDGLDFCHVLGEFDLGHVVHWSQLEALLLPIEIIDVGSMGVTLDWARKIEPS